MTTSMRALLFVLLIGCGAAPAPLATHPPQAVALISRTPWSITIAPDAILTYAADGRLALEGDALGMLGDDGALMRGDETIATLAPDGSMTLGGETLAPHIVGSRMLEGDVAVLEIDEDDALHVRAPDGRELATFVIDGAGPEAHPTALFLTAVYLLDAARDAESAEIDEDEVVEEAEDELAEDEEDQDLWRMPLDGAPSEGPTDALVTIVELTDFQCPYCARGDAVMMAIRQRFPDVRLVVRQRPLPFHENARPAAEAALEARAQLGDAGFFRMTALLFANQRGLTRATLERLAIVVGLDLVRFRHALDTSAHDAAISEDMALGDRMGAEGTPTFYVNGELMIGAQPLSSFVHAVERARARAQAALDAGASRDRLYDTMLAHAQDPAPARVDPPRPAPPAPSDVARAPAGAQAVSGGAFVIEHAGAGDGAERIVRARVAAWNAQGLVLEGASASPINLALDGLEPTLQAALRGIRASEIRRIWLPGSRVLWVEAIDVE